MYTLAMTINHCYWEYDYKQHCIRQVEKKSLKSHFWKQGNNTAASQNKANLSLVASFAKSSPFKLLLLSTPKKQSNSLWVDLSSKLANNSKLTSDKYKKCLKNNLCLYCGVGDCKLDFCSKK